MGSGSKFLEAKLGLMNGKGFRIPRQSNVNTFTIYYETAVNNEPPLLLESLCAQRCGGPNPNKMEKPLSR